MSKLFDFALSIHIKSSFVGLKSFDLSFNQYMGIC